MAHFPRIECPRFELYREQPITDRERCTATKEMHMRINKELRAESGLWWSEQRFVDQIVPSECVNPDSFDTVQYRYQVFARPPPMMCPPRTLAEASDQLLPVRYNVKRIARDKPLPDEVENHFWTRYAPKLIISPQACQGTEDCSKNNNVRSICQRSSHGKIDNVTSDCARGKTTVRQIGPSNKMYAIDFNAPFSRNITSHNCVRNSWTIDAGQVGKNLSAHRGKQWTRLYTRCESPLNQMYPKSEEQTGQTISNDVSKEEAPRPGSSKSSDRLGSSRSGSSCSSQCCALEKNNNCSGTQSHLNVVNQNGKEYRLSPRTRNLSGCGRRLHPVLSSSNNRAASVSHSHVKIVPKHIPPFGKKTNNNKNNNHVIDTYEDRNQNNSDNNVQDNDTAIIVKSEGYENRPEGMLNFDTLIFKDDDHTTELRSSQYEKGTEQKHSRHALDFLFRYPKPHSQLDNICLCQNNNAESDEINMDMSGKYCREPFPRPPAPTPKRSYCGGMVFNRTATCPRLIMPEPSPYTQTRSPPITAKEDTKNIMKQSSASQAVAAITENKRDCYRLPAKCAYYSGNPHIVKNARDVPQSKPPEIGYNTYKIIGGKQYCPPQQEDVLSDMKLPPHLAEYREFTQRCPNFLVGRYNRLDPANEVLLPSSRAVINMKSSLTPFIYTKNPKYGKFPPLFHQPTNTDTMQWHLPVFVNQCQQKKKISET